MLPDCGAMSIRTWQKCSIRPMFSHFVPLHLSPEPVSTDLSGRETGDYMLADENALELGRARRKRHDHPAPWRRQIERSCRPSRIGALWLAQRFSGRLFRWRVSGCSPSSQFRTNLENAPDNTIVSDRVVTRNQLLLISRNIHPKQGSSVPFRAGGHCRTAMTEKAKRWPRG